MKTLPKFLLVLYVLMFFCTVSYSQFNVLNKVKNIVTDKVSNQVDKVINRQVDSIEKKVVDKQVNKVNESLDKKRNEILNTGEQKSESKVISTGSPVSVANSKGKGKYALKSAIVEYKTITMGIEGKQILYFDNYGEKEAYETEMSVFGFTSRTITIYGDDCSYTVDLVKKTATKSSSKDNPYNIDFERLAQEAEKEWKIQKEGSETLLGRECIKYSITNIRNSSMNGFFWVWKGIPFKTEMNMIGTKMVLEAQKIDENVSIPADKFIIPADVEILESE